MYYPFISIGSILFAHASKRTKWLGIGFTAFLLLFFIGLTQYEYKIKTGTIEYSAFGGWQLAASALYGYAYANPDDPTKVPGKFRSLHTLVNKHMDSLRHLAARPDQEVGVYYFWDFKSPLRVYMNELLFKRSNSPYFTRWALMAPLYAAYGRYLIMKHPLPFLRHYVWPNLVKYYAPPAQFMALYNLGNKRVDSIAVTWFGWKNNKLPTRTYDLRIPVAQVFSLIAPVINVVFVASFLAFISLGGFRQCNACTKRVLLYTLIIWFGNMVFSIFTAPIELRYQLFPLLITFVWDVIFVAFIVQQTKHLPGTGISTHEAMATEYSPNTKKDILTT
jgi:hypothetical protein